MSETIWLSPQQVADRLGCGMSFVFALLREGELPRVKLGQRTKVPADSVSAYMERRIREAARQREIRPRPRPLAGARRG